LPAWLTLATVGVVACGGAVIGVVTKTGSAVMIVPGGFADAPGLVARREAGLVTAALPDQPWPSLIDPGRGSSCDPGQVTQAGPC